MAGFKFRYRENGGTPTIKSVIMGTASLTSGDTVVLSSGQAAIGATNGTFLGVVAETKTGTVGTSRIQVYTDPDAVYGVADANARLVGAKLDVSGATAAQTVAAATNSDLVVQADSSATEETLVRFNVGHHWQNKAL